MERALTRRHGGLYISSPHKKSATNAGGSGMYARTKQQQAGGASKQAAVRDNLRARAHRHSQLLACARHTHRHGSSSSQPAHARGRTSVAACRCLCTCVPPGISAPIPTNTLCQQSLSRDNARAEPRYTAADVYLRNRLAGPPARLPSFRTANYTAAVASSSAAAAIARRPRARPTNYPR